MDIIFWTLNYRSILSSDLQVAKTEELSVELINLANANAVLMRTREGRVSKSPSAEVQRVRAIVSRHSNRIRVRLSLLLHRAVAYSWLIFIKEVYHL